MKSHSTVLLTGATGFLGSRILARLASEGWTIVCLKRPSSSLGNLRGLDPLKVFFYDSNQIDLKSVFALHPIEMVLHCATDYGRTPGSSSSSVLENNLMFPIRLMEVSKTCGVKFFLNTDTTLHRDVNAYALSKKQFVEWLKRPSNNFCAINIALENFYGPNEGSDKFISSVISKLLRNVPSLDLTLGEQRRDFIYIDDVIEAYMTIIDRHMGTLDAFTSGFFSYDVGTGELTSIRDCARLIKSLVANSVTELKFGAIPYRDNEIMESCADNSKVRALGWTPQTDFESGIAKTVAYMRNEFENPKERPEV